MWLPKDSVAIIYLTPIPRLIIGASGQHYYVKPNVILVDVSAADVRAWIAAKQARKPTLQEMTTHNGYIARQS